MNGAKGYNQVFSTDGDFRRDARRCESKITVSFSLQTNYWLPPVRLCRCRREFLLEEPVVCVGACRASLLHNVL